MTIAASGAQRGHRGRLSSSIAARDHVNQLGDLAALLGFIA
jgi:hypothetical protein